MLDSLLKCWINTCFASVLICTGLYGQNYLGFSYQHGYNVPAYERSPETTRTSPFLALTYKIKHRGKQSTLGRLYGGPDLNLHAFYQNLGNDEVMGYALGFVPELRFMLFSGRRSAWYGGGGLGAAWVNLPYDKRTNPLNQALGTPWNIYAQAGIEYRYTFTEEWSKKWSLGLEFAIHHLSNSFFSFPNLGVNIPHVGISLNRRLSEGSLEALNPIATDKSRINRSGWRPFARYIYGITERAYDGPKFSIQGAGLGVYKRIAPHRTVLLGGEYMFDESSYYFVSRASGSDGADIRDQARRYLLFAGHEYAFGYLSFVTEAGIYLSEQFNRQSIISAKVGFNFFPFHQLYHLKHQFSVGVFIRAYFLRADFFEINANYRF